VPDETAGAKDGQAPANAQPQVGASQPQAGDGQSSQADGPDNGSSTDVATLQKALTESNREAAKYRTEARKLTDAIKAAEDAKLPEQERLQRRLAELEAAHTEHERERAEWTTQAAVTKAALRLGFQDPVDAYALLDRAAVDRDESGVPRNVDKLLTDLLRAKPYLGGAGRPSGSADGGVQGQMAQPTDMNARIRAAAGRG
jgi:hypothetical protein